MNIDKYQAQILLEQLDRAVYDDLSNYITNRENDKQIQYEIRRDKVESMCYEQAGTFLRVQENDTNLYFQLRSKNGSIESSWTFGGFNYHWSKAGKIWKKLKKVAIRYEDHARNELALKKKQIETEAFNNIVYSTYQDEVNEILLGKGEK